jgi:hypothetical protein
METPSHLHMHKNACAEPMLGYTHTACLDYMLLAVGLGLEEFTRLRKLVRKMAGLILQPAKARNMKKLYYRRLFVYSLPFLFSET